MAIGSDAQFAKFCSLVGVADFAERKEFSTNKMRVKNRTLLQRELATPIARFMLTDLVDACIDAGIPMGAIKNMKEVFENPVAQSMILEEDMEGRETKRVQTIAFTIKR